MRKNTYGNQDTKPVCTCSAADMPFGSCCKVRAAFEDWYNKQGGEGIHRIQPFDVFKAGVMFGQFGKSGEQS